MTRRYDIVMVTDARLPGGTSASVAEEIRAQASAGFRTGLLHVASPLVTLDTAFAPRLRRCVERGEAEVIVGDEPVDTDLVVLRHPRVAAAADPAALPTIRSEHRLLVVNQAPGMPAGPSPDDDQALRYEPTAVAEHLQAWLGGEVAWTPIGPLVRADLARTDPGRAQLDDDWVNVIDVDAWARHRTPGRHRIPVIGRHSRNDPLKWPATREEVLRVYPDGDDVEVHVLGGAPRVRELFDGAPPANWVLRPFGSMPPERFLAGIDVYVYFHHPRLVEAFGRTILEALASGAPTILPAHFAELFGEAATYAGPDEVLGLVHHLHGDAAAYRDASERALAATRQRFGHEVHVARVSRYAAPTGTPARRYAAERGAGAVTGEAAADTGEVTGEATGEATADAAATARRVLFVSSNGAGVGHLMRLMALARTAGDDVEPLFLTFSQGARVVDDAGHLVEYLASRSVSGAASRLWHPHLEERVHELIERYDVRAVVFDGTWPYQGLLDAVGQHPGVRLVWSRRAMWKPGVVNDVLATQTARFDLIIEPGEFAEDEDRGETRDHRGQAVRVGPVTYLGPEEVLGRDEARDELGLDPARPAVLVNLGAGNINDAASQLGMVVERLAREPEVQVCVTRSIIADRDTSLPDNVRSISVYPLARYLAAFDFAFAASGYNSYHELLLAAVPTAWVPNLDTATDDQAARSRFAERVGVGIDLAEPTPEAVDAAVRRLLDVEARHRMHERAVARRRENGADDAMAAITTLLDRVDGARLTPAQLRAAIDARRAARQGSPTGSGPARTAPPATADTPADTPGPAPDAGAGPDAGAAVGAADPDRADALRRRTARTARGLLVGGRRQLVRARRAAARTAKQERVQTTLLAPYKRLPEPVKARVRQAVQRWEPPQTREDRPRPTPLPVPVGTAAPATPPDAPRVLVVTPAQADPQALTVLVERTAQLQAATRAFAPMFFTSTLEFRALRAYGYLVEYFPPRERWGRLASDDAWFAARAERLRSVIRRFGIDTVVTLPEVGEDGVEALVATLVAVVESLTAEE